MYHVKTQSIPIIHTEFNIKRNEYVRITKHFKLTCRYFTYPRLCIEWKTNLREFSSCRIGNSWRSNGFSSRKRFDWEKEDILLGCSSSSFFFLLISINGSCSHLLSGTMIWGVFEGFLITRQSS